MENKLLDAQNELGRKDQCAYDLAILTTTVYPLQTASICELIVNLGRTLLNITLERNPVVFRRFTLRPPSDIC